MDKIVIISSSIRKGRKSHRVAAYFTEMIRSQGIGEPVMLDLLEYNFPLFEERLKFLENPSAELLDFTAKVKEAAGILIITPEYNGGLPASLKNALDVLLEEWKGKPVGLVAVSGGQFGGSQVLQGLSFILFKMGITLVPASFQVPFVDKAFNEDGSPTDKEATDKRALIFLERFKTSLRLFSSKA